MSIEPDCSLFKLDAMRQPSTAILGEPRQTVRVLAGLSNHLLKDIGYVRNSLGVIRPI